MQAPSAASRSTPAPGAGPRRPRWDVENWKDADKVLLISSLTLPFAAAWLARVLQVRGDPTLSPYVSRAFLPTLLPFLVVQALGHVTLIVAALAARGRGAHRSPWLVHLEIQFWFLCMSFSLYTVGPFTSSFGVLVLALPVIGYQLFDERPMHLGLVTLLGGAAVGVVLPQLGLLPYAPFVAHPPYDGGRLHPGWILSIGIPSVFAVAVVLFIHVSLMRRLRLRQAELQQLSRTDALTGLANRAAFFERLEGEVARAARHELPLCVVMLDVDHFKQINDTHGHLAGDDVLRQLSAALGGAVRTHDLAARYGGEEFAIVLPHAPLEHARAVTSRLADAARGVAVRGQGGADAITVSMGVAELAPGEDADALVARADAALYESKRAGRDRVTMAARPPASQGAVQGATRPPAQA